MKKILFQGDSITDAGRKLTEVNVCTGFGTGYAMMVAGELGFTYPNEYEVVNRGVSGNRIVDLYARMKADILNIKPDILSILIGVNDVGHEFAHQNGVDADKFFRMYCLLIEEVKEALPNLKIMILEPFVLKGDSTEEHWDDFRAEVDKRAAMAKKVAETYDLLFVPLQAEFDKRASQIGPNEYWIKDGIHPSVVGHELIKREWMKEFQKLSRTLC